jgi:hypothetical protein
MFQKNLLLRLQVRREKRNVDTCPSKYRSIAGVAKLA